MIDLNFPPEDNGDGEQASNASHRPNEKKCRQVLTDQQRQEIYIALLERSSHGRLKRDSTKHVAEAFNVNLRTVQRIWKRAKDCRDQNVPVNVSSRKRGKCGRKKLELNLSRVSTIPLHKRSTIRSLAEALGVNKSSLHRAFKQGLLRRHSCTLKPYLKEANKKARLHFCLSMLDPETLRGEPKFINMQNIVHIDEKWFYLSKKDRKFYLLNQENNPNRCVHNKNAIAKVMFLSAVARPRYDEEGNCIFDGKIGVWPFVRKEPAQRSSHNRSRGTIVTKPMKVDRNTVRRYLISYVLPAIKALWPRDEANKTIWIQQDNARTHVPVNDEEFCRAAEQTGLDIRLMNQPPNSPDLNVLDLGFFASLQSLTEKRIARNIDDLIYNVRLEFHSYEPATLNRVFLTLQGCMLEIMRAQGGNGYKIPHMGKERLNNVDNLPISLSCDPTLLESVMVALDNDMSS